MHAEHNEFARRRRRMLGDRSNTDRVLPSQALQSQSSQLTQAERMARKAKRSTDVIEALRRLDTAPTQQARQEILDWLQQVYQSRGGGPLVGLFGHCYLGAPYVDHAFELTGQIREHYTAADTVPAIYTGARTLAMSTAYAFIEIYADGQVIPVRPDGSSGV